MIEHRSSWPRGKVLGGSSTLNYMLYIRGNKKGNLKFSFEKLIL